jgi:hypothetical protein
MAKDFQKKEPSKYEKYVEYRFQAIEHDLVNLQRQVTTVARIVKMAPEDFIKGMNDTEGYKKFIDDLNKAYDKFREANPVPAADPASPVNQSLPAMPPEGE